MKKRLLAVVLSILFVSTAYLIFYLNQYSIEAEESEVQTSLTEWNNRGSEYELKFEILEIVRLGQTNSHIVLLETSAENMGYAHLVEGWNGKYKIRQSGWGSGVASFRDVETNGGMYGVLIGKNPDLKIDHILAESENKEFSFTSSVAGSEKYVRYEKLPPKLKQTFPPDITLYDANGNVLDPLLKGR